MRNLLVAVDFSQHTPRVLEVAEKLAREFDCPMRLVHVDDTEKPNFQEMVEIKDNEKKMEALASRMRSAGLEASAIAKKGPILESLLEEIRLHDIEHIVAGTHGHSAAKELFRVLSASVHTFGEIAITCPGLRRYPCRSRASSPPGPVRALWRSAAA